MFPPPRSDLIVSFALLADDRAVDNPQNGAAVRGAAAERSTVASPTCGGASTASGC